MTFYLIGIKGSGMSALALLLKAKGHTVLGCDFDNYFFTEDKLKEEDIKIEDFSSMKIANDKIYIIGNAFEDYKYISLLKKSDCLFFKYNEFISNIDTPQIAISGTHGKTTTTTIVKDILKTSYNVDYIIGDGTGHGVRNSDFFVYEACEYKNHFLAYHPDYLIINNIELDHTDFFKGFDDLKESFIRLAEQSKVVIVNGDLIEKGLLENAISFGFKKDNDYVMDIEGEELIINENRFKVSFTSKHMLYNFAAGIVLSEVLAISNKKIQEGIDSFTLPKRRMNEHIVGETILVDDYAHHPTEIEATINHFSLKYPKKKIVIIFQPHTYARTLAFVKEFVSSLSKAYKVYIADIFSSIRETKKYSLEFFLKEFPDAKYFDSDLKHFKQYEGNVIILMGAGDIYKYLSPLENVLND